MLRALPLMLALLGAGCTPTSYAFTPSTRGEVARPKGCAFEIMASAPDNVSYEDIGRFDHYNGSVPKSVDDLRKAIASRVCTVGGDAVIATPDAKGEYRTAQVIKLTGPGLRPIQ